MAAILPLQLQVSPKRLAFVVFVFVLSLHYLFNVVFKDASPLPTLLDLQNHIGISRKAQPRLDNSTKLAVDPTVELETAPPIYVAPDVPDPNGRANATFVLLCRNNDVNGAVASIQQLEDRFNRRHGYPWVLLNDEPFTDEFKERVRILTDAPIHFGLVPREHWQQPDWVDEDHAKAGREKMTAQGIIYASSVSYRNMCRFNSGFFFHHELLQPYRYYWRVEPDVKFFCDVNYDPFKFMQENNKIYGYTISLVEWEATIPSLWSTVKEFVAKHPEYVSPDNSLQFLSDDGGNTYNLCHFWSNFEIADMDFWRGEAYQKFFDYLESKGGFYYERWGDAPVHSIAAALFARKEQIHFFRDIGYRHDSFQHCPTGNDWVKGRCSCDPKDSFDYGWGSCTKKHEELFL